MAGEAMDCDVVTVTLNPALDWTLTVPRVVTGRVNRVAHAEMRPGGKGVNVALALGDYGVATGITGLMGNTNDELFRHHFASRGIVDRVVRVDGTTRTGIKIVDPERDETTDLNFDGRPCTGDEVERCFGVLREWAGSRLRWFVLAGSLPPGVDAGIYRDWTRALKHDGHGVLVDASGEALRQALESPPDILKPNQHELEGLLGRPLHTTAEVVNAARELLARGVGLVVVSRGAHGALFVSERETLEVEPVRVEVGSTVGAGDAMVAGVVAGRLDGLPLSAVAARATAFSLAVLTGDRPLREVVAAWQSRVNVRPFAG